jgi:hypothetical protein
VVDQSLVDTLVDSAIARDSASVSDAAVVPLAGFGALLGPCGVLDDEEWSAATKPFYFQNTIDFGSANFEKNSLSSGGKKVLDDDNLGGSSLHSEVFAYEVLYRCELAKLLHTEREIRYKDESGKKTDLLVEIDGRKVGVSVTRAFHYPPGQPYTESEANKLLAKKLPDVLASSANAKATFAWKRAMLYVIAADQQHAETLKVAYDKLDAATRANTLLLVTVTDGKDDYIY